MRSSILLFLANAAILAAGTPTPADSAPRYKCTSLAAVGDAQTPSVKSGIVDVPTVPIPGANTGVNKVLICCTQAGAGALGLQSASCFNGVSSTDGTCPTGRALCCGAVAANSVDLGALSSAGIYSLCEIPTSA